MTATQTPDYSAWTLCFAKGQMHRDFLEGAPVASNQGMVPIPMIYSVIVAESPGERRVFLVDTGFSGGESMTGRRFDDFETPDQVLAKIGLTPADIDAIILTHLHFDHAGNLAAFPDVPIYLQDREYRCWRDVVAAAAGGGGKARWPMSSMNPDDWPSIEHAVQSGRVRFVDGDEEIHPGLVLHLEADAHCFGCQWIELRTPEGPYVLAGDNVVTYANLERMWPPGYHQGNAWNLVDCYRRILELVGDDAFHRISPGHDMSLFERVPSFVAGANPVAELRAGAGRSRLGGTDQQPTRGSR